MARFSIYMDGKHKGIYRAADRKRAIWKLLEAQRFDSLLDFAEYNGVTAEEALAQFNVINVDEIAIDKACFSSRWIKENKWVEDDRVRRGGYYTERVIFGDVNIGRFKGQWKAINRHSPDNYGGTTTLRYVSAQSHDYSPSSKAFPFDNSPEMDVIGKEVINRHADTLHEFAVGCIDALYEDSRYYGDLVIARRERKILRKENRRRESLLYFK